MKYILLLMLFSCGGSYRHPDSECKNNVVQRSNKICFRSNYKFCYSCEKIEIHQTYGVSSYNGINCCEGDNNTCNDPVDILNMVDILKPH